ncbi:MAG: sugar phosphate nucleotidyltransferase [Verrucomicrobia bacterium]|nr:sugar phosphate nucleotidyltransferase [Verrucomicrobiota bacterium]
MKAFVLGAGLGTRLRPLTERRPKPLVPLYGKPLITFGFDHLIANGITSFVVNTHHCPEAYDQLLPGDDYCGIPIEYRHEPVLLDTGGGIKNVESFVGGESFVAYNGDILADFPLRPAIDRHLKSGHLATLVLRSSGGPLHVQAHGGLVTDIRGRLANDVEQASRLLSQTGNRDGRPTSPALPPVAPSDPSYLFTGITILSPEIFLHIPLGQIISIIPIYLDLLRAGAKIGAHIADEGLWFDLGTRDAYLAAHALLQPGGYPLSHARDGWPAAMAADSRIASTASLQGACAIGAGATVGRHAILQDCVLWENAVVAPQSRLTRCVVRDGMVAAGTFDGTDF